MENQITKAIKYFDGDFTVLLIEGRRPVLWEDIKTIEKYTVEERDEIRATIKADLIRRGLLTE